MKSFLRTVEIIVLVAQAALNFAIIVLILKKWNSDCDDE